MDQQPDKLFRDRLHGHDAAVPPQVWSRVSGNVQSTRRSAWWLSAAAVGLFASAVLFIYPLIKEPMEVAGKATQPAHEQSPVIKESDKTGTDAEKEKNNVVKNDALQKESTLATGMEIDKPARKKSAAPEQQKQRAVDNLKPPAIAMPEPDPVAIVNAESILPDIIEETNPEPNAARKTVTIVFSAQEVNERYLSKIPPPQATSDEKEASTLKNMLDKAYDLTHNQDPLGELRQKKNEILAMNFRRDKPRTQTE